jgi:hypothetical protein
MHDTLMKKKRLGMTKVSLLLDVFDRNCPHRL